MAATWTAVNVSLMANSGHGRYPERRQLRVPPYAVPHALHVRGRGRDPRGPLPPGLPPAARPHQDRRGRSGLPPRLRGPHDLGDAPGAERRQHHLRRGEGGPRRRRDRRPRPDQGPLPRRLDGRGVPPHRLGVRHPRRPSGMRRGSLRDHPHRRRHGLAHHHRLQPRRQVVRPSRGSGDAGVAARLRAAVREGAAEAVRGPEGTISWRSRGATDLSSCSAEADSCGSVALAIRNPRPALSPRRTAFRRPSAAAWP